jgi:hypothetical protein
MWVFDYPHQESGWYYKVDGGVLWKLDGEEDLTWVESTISLDVGNWVEDLTPLPNVEIPWEATEDRKCPVPTGSQCQITLLDGRVDTCEGYSPHRHNWALSTQNPITAYKIIDEDYLPSVATVTITEDSATTEPGVVVTVYETVEDKLTKRLEFLQNLANKFPEIRNEAIKFMECELDGYMNTLWEKDNEE